MTTEPKKTPSGSNTDPASGGGGDPTDKDKETDSNTNPDASGDDEGGEGEAGKGTVSYDSHRKLLAEKKAEQARRTAAEAKLAALEKEKADKEKAEAEAQGNYKKLYEQTQKELEEEKQKSGSILGEITDAQKRRAILKHIGGVVHEGAMQLLPLSMIELTADGKPTEQSAKAAAQIFQKEHPYAIQKDVEGGGGLPNDEAKGGGKGKKITYAEWNNLSATEMKKQYGNVDWSTAPK